MFDISTISKKWRKINKVHQIESILATKLTNTIMLHHYYVASSFEWKEDNLVIENENM